MDDREILAKTIMAEAGNQGPQGMLAVGSVIMNRARQGGYGDGVQGVIMKPGQFSPWNSVTGYVGGEQGQDMSRIRPTQQAYAITDALMSGQYEDPTGGATHFFNPAISQPSWGRGGDWTRIGDHVFGRADASKGGSTMTPQRGLLAQGPTISTSGDATAMAQGAPQGRMPFYKNKDLMARLAMAFNSMRLNPDPNLAAVMQSGIQQRAEQARTEQQRSRTADWLESQGLGPLAQGVRSGALTGQEAMALATKSAPKGQVVGNRIVDPTTGKVIYDGGPDQDAVQKARKEFTSLPQVKAFSEQTSAYGRIIASAEDPSPAGDLALIFNYMKVLDPGSVVREGEFATAQNAGGVDQRVRSLYNNIISGERLTPEQRSDFADRATRLYQEADQQYRSLAGQYSGFATAAGLPVEQVIPDFGYSGELYQTPLEFQRPPAPAGVSEEEWRTTWGEMTDEERRLFLEGTQ